MFSHDFCCWKEYVRSFSSFKGPLNLFLILLLALSSLHLINGGNPRIWGFFQVWQCDFLELRFYFKTPNSFRPISSLWTELGYPCFHIILNSFYWIFCMLSECYFSFALLTFVTNDYLLILQWHNIYDLVHSWISNYKIPNYWFTSY